MTESALEQTSVGVHGQTPSPKASPWLFRLLFGVVGALLLVAAVFDLETTSRAWDAHTLKAWAERVQALDVGLYTGSANQRGPLWLILYLAPLHLGSEVSYWFFIALFIVVVATITGFAVAAATLWRSRCITSSWVAGLSLFVYLVLGPEEFSQVLYSRNISGMLTAMAFALLWRAVSVSTGRKSAAYFAASGACAGLAIQTVPTAAAPVFVLGVALCLVCLAKPRRVALTPSLALGAWASACCAVLSAAPLYYLVRGEFTAFWDLYWRYNLVYSDATGRSVPGQFLKGARDFAMYYAKHPVYVVIISAFVVSTVVQWRRLTKQERVFDAALVTWWLAELLSVTLAQRFFPHYLVLPIIPMAIMGGVLLAQVVRPLPGRGLGVLPLVAVVSVSYLGGAERTLRGLQRAERFSGLQQHAEDHFLAAPPERRTQKALMDVATASSDYIWVWSEWPGFYTDLARTPATRYSSRHWLIGLVYGGGTSSRFILPGTFENWAADMRRTPPTAFIASDEVPRPPQGHPVEKFIRRDYTSVFSGANSEIFLRNDRHRFLQLLLQSDGGTPARLSVLRSRSAGGAIGASSSGDDVAPVPGDVVEVEKTSGCSVVSAQLHRSRSGSPASSVVISLADPIDTHRLAEVTILPDAGVSHRTWPLGMPVEARVTLDPPPSDSSEELRVVLNGRSALVTLDGRIVGAMRSSSSDPLLLLSAASGEARFTNVKTRDMDTSAWPPCSNTDVTR